MSRAAEIGGEVAHERWGTADRSQRGEAVFCLFDGQRQIRRQARFRLLLLRQSQDLFFAGKRLFQTIYEQTATVCSLTAWWCSVAEVYSIMHGWRRIYPKNSVMVKILERDAIQKLARDVEESTRSTREGIKYFIEPAPGTLARAKYKRHHIVFGRRGSGKSSLLSKVTADLTVNRTPIAYVDLEEFKDHSYPDVLLSVCSLKRFVNSRSG
jgi:hypothetical protein